MQSALDKLNTYCDKWNLDINVEKTKIMIFNKSGRMLKQHKFLINNTHISATDTYKYLGTIFKPSGSFSATVKHLSNKATKQKTNQKRYLAFIISFPKTDLH